MRTSQERRKDNAGFIHSSVVRYDGTNLDEVRMRLLERYQVR